MGTVINNNDNLQNNKFIPNGEITKTERHGNTTVVYTKDFAYAIPDDINETTNATLIVHGDGGLPYMLEHSGLGICEYLDSNDVNSVFVMPLTGNGEEHAEYFANELNNVSEQLNLENKEKSIISYSNGVYVTDDVAQKLIESDPDLPPLKIALIDPDTEYLSSPSTKMATTITSNNPNVIIFEKNGELYSREKDFYKFYDKYVDNGVNISFVGGDKDHGYEFFDAISDGLLETMSNDSASEYAKTLFDSRRDRGYRVVEFDGGRFTDIDTNLVAPTFDRNIQSFPTYDTTFINPINNDLVNRIANLSDLTISSSLRTKLGNSPKGIEILSNLEYVNSSMNSLRAFARTIAASAAASSSFSGIFANKVVSLIQKYYSYLVELMNSLTDETMAIESFAEGIADMDSYFANNVPEEKVDTVSNGNVPNMPSTANTSSMDTQSSAIRPSKPEGSDITPISYSKFTKKQDNNDNMVYTYYDKNGNVIGEIVKNGSDVVSSYYDYENADGSIVRVNYDNELSSAGAAVGVAATTGATSAIIQEESSLSGGVASSNVQEENRVRGRRRNTGNADIIFEDEIGNNKVEQSTDNSGEEKHGTVFMANPDESVIGKTPDGQDIIVSENKVDGVDEQAAPNNKNGISYRTVSGDGVSVDYDKDAKSLTIDRENTDGSGKSITNDMGSGTTTYTHRKADGTVIEEVTDKYSGAQMITTTDADGNSTTIFRDRFGRKIPQDDLINDIFGLNKEELVISDTPEQVSNDVTGQVGTETSGTVVQEQPQTVSEQTQTVVEQPQVVVEDNKPVTSGSTSGGGTSGSSSRRTSGGGSTYTPTPQPSVINNTQPDVINDVKPVPEIQKPVDEIKEPEVIVKPEVDEKTSTPTYTNNYGPYNYYNNTPRREETIVPTIDKSVENIDKEVIIPDVDNVDKTQVIDNKETITTETHKNSGNNNAGRVLGTIAGVAAAGAGLAGLAYGANKIIKEQDEEDNEEDKDEYEKDENGEISLSNEI